MKALACLGLVVGLSAVGFGEKVWVPGHYTKSGKYVPGHYVEKRNSKGSSSKSKSTNESYSHLIQPRTSKRPPKEATKPATDTALPRKFVGLTFAESARGSIYVLSSTNKKVVRDDILQTITFHGSTSWLSTRDQYVTFNPSILPPYVELELTHEGRPYRVRVFML